MRKTIIISLLCALYCGVRAQNNEPGSADLKSAATALNSFMEKYSSTWPKANSMNSEALRQLGSKMPDFYLSKKYNSKKLKGQFVLLNFWATWCSGCRLLSVDLDSLMIKNNREEFADVQLLGVDAQENVASKGFDPDEWWAEKGIGFPTVGGQGADDCCLAVKGGHPCMMLIDDKGIIRGRWDAWTPSAAEEARLAVWALHVVPRDGIKADSATVCKYLSAGRKLEAAYLLTLMPEEVNTVALRFKALTAVNSNDAVAYFNKFAKQCEAFKPSEVWALWKMPQAYVDALKDISEYVYQSDTDDASLLDCGSKAVRLLMNTSRSQSVHLRTMLGVLHYRYGQTIMKSGRYMLDNMYSQESLHSKDKAKYQEVEDAMRKYGIETSKANDELGCVGGFEIRRNDLNPSVRRMLEVDEESRRHMAGLNDTIDVVKDVKAKVQAVFIVPQKLRSGKQSALEARITIADGWHAYADTEKNRNEGFIPTTVEFTFPSGFKAVGKQSVYPEQGDKISGSIYVSQKFVCPNFDSKALKKGYPVKMKLVYQICDEGHCLPPVEIETDGLMRCK